jgi:2-oxoglutarate ferredoxin oxidoreductase subunit delta
MTHKKIPDLPHLPVSPPAILPQFGNPLLLAEAIHGIEPKTTHELVRGTVPESPLSPKSLVNIHPELCKGCELCVYTCPSGNLSLSPEFNRKGYHPVLFSFNGDRGPCSACGLCYWVCPDFAIAEIKKLKQ